MASVSCRPIGKGQSTWVALFVAGALLALTSPAAARQSGRPGPVLLPKRTLAGGVTTFTHDRASLARATPYVLDAAPEAIVGGPDADPAYDLTSLLDVALLSGGRLACFVQGHRVLLFNRDGTPWRTIGRHGAGPGEFMGGREMLGLRADTLLLLDMNNRRLNWIVPSAGVVRSEPVQDRIPGVYATPVGVLPGGRVILTNAGQYREMGGAREDFRSVASLFLLPTRGAATTIATMPDLLLRRMRNSIEPGRPDLTDFIRFGPNARSTVWDTLIASTTGTTYEVVLRNSRGVVIQKIVLPATPRRPVTAKMRQENISVTMSAWYSQPRDVTSPDSARVEAFLRAAPFADSLPVTAELFVTPDRTLWVLDGHTPGESSWTATGFRTDGAIVGRLRADRGGLPVAFGNDRVVLKSTDKDGVVKLATYRFRIAGKQ